MLNVISVTVTPSSISVRWEHLRTNKNTTHYKKYRHVSTGSIVTSIRFAKLRLTGLINTWLSCFVLLRTTRRSSSTIQNAVIVVSAQLTKLWIYPTLFSLFRYRLMNSESPKVHGFLETFWELDGDCNYYRAASGPGKFISLNSERT